MGLPRNGLQDLTKYPYGGSDKENFLPVMKGLTNHTRWLVFCLGREGKKKSCYNARECLSSPHAHVRARPAKSPATQATHQHTPTRSNPAGGLFSSILARFIFIITLRKVLFQVGQGSFTLSEFS